MSTEEVTEEEVSIGKIGDWNKTRKYEEDMYWFSEVDLSAYEGKYVATIGKEVVAFRDNAKTVLEEAKKKFPREVPILAKIPKGDLLIL